MINTDGIAKDKDLNIKNGNINNMQVAIYANAVKKAA